MTVVGEPEPAENGRTAVGSPAEERKVFAARLREAGLDPKQFIDVHDGEKRSTDHTQRGPETRPLTATTACKPAPAQGR